MNIFIKRVLALSPVISLGLACASQPPAETVNSQITARIAVPAVVDNSSEKNSENKAAVKSETQTDELTSAEKLTGETVTDEASSGEALTGAAAKMPEQKTIQAQANEQLTAEQVAALPSTASPVTVSPANKEPVKAAARVPDARQLLEFIDSLRGYQGQSFTFDISNISFKQNEQKHRNKLAVKVLSDTSLVEFTAPARSKGRKILKQAQNMWIRFPGTRNVLRISPAQRLLGEASNGDVTGTNFSQDYNASYDGTEMLNDKPVLKLNLSASHDKTTYKQVMFYLDSDSHLPLRSDFYARSGKLAKQAYYTQFKEFDGELKLHRMKLVDPIVAGSYTWMMFDNYQKQDLDAAIFHKDALSR